ncbi:hypothetical protein BCR39DRAFT_292376 [Naematelia encephala]|uniref:Uncharacterized protein n=1 Tax=Naematelia encephala TaxID=71784 RepID=A0A1Y2AS09_9TREE|nr:hypothetical protein BCR39DRAFT_292376 [Naematelia encephala]
MTPLPETPSPSDPKRRYPAHLSRNKPGPSKNPQPPRKQPAPATYHPLPPKPVTRTKQPPRSKPTHNTIYPAPSIDTTSRPPLQPAPQPPTHEYSSLADLLQEAGYKHTRVYTPEAERLRGRIRRTLDEPDSDEVDALYQTYGFGGTMQNQHRILNVTEPTIPLKSSSSLLRSALAQQDSPANSDHAGSYESSQGWWTGVLGRVGKAVMEVSPPMAFDEPPRAVGLGLAKGGEGVRKVKSNWELDRSAASRRAQTDSPVAQEDRTPVARSFTDEARVPSGFRGVADPPASIQAFLHSLPTIPPPPPIEDDAYGYCPLPTDYEAQCEDDELYGMSFGEVDVGSLGSSRESSEDRELRESEQEDVDDVLVLGGVADDLRRRVMHDAVEYDESFDSPPVHPVSLPTTEDESPQRPFDNRTRQTPSPEPETELEPEPETVLRQEEPIPEKKPLKYGDRARRLRMAKSTPLLHTIQPRPSWLGSIRAAFFGTEEASPSYVTLPSAPASGPSAPIRITPAAPAAPALVTASPVICDSTSTDSVDLPAFPSAAPSSAALRLRPSLARLREVVGISPVVTSTNDNDDAGLVLSPRLDWDATGQQFAGWNSTPDRKRPGLPWASTVVKASEEGIDYSKSFFYKPATPPHHSHSSSPSSSTSTCSISEGSGSISSVSETSNNDTTPLPAPAPGPRRPAPSTPGPRKQRSIKSLRAALLLPVAPPPPVPRIPDSLKHLHLRPGTPPPPPSLRGVEPPVLAISSPGAWEAGLPPRELVLEGEEWDARDGNLPGDWGKGLRGKSKGKKGKKRSKKDLKA